MDALAMYSSDSDDNSSMPPVQGSSTTDASQHHPLATSKEIDNKQDATGNEHQIASNVESKIAFQSESPPKKRRLDHEHQDSNSFLAQYQLPQPTLKTKPTLSTWSRDYLSLKDSSIKNSKSCGDAVLPEYPKFQALSNAMPPSQKSWSSHLREQQEFHNPHFFQSVVEYYRIKEPLGSHLDRVGRATEQNASTTSGGEAQDDEKT